MFTAEMNNAYGLQKVQEANLKMLKEIDRICTKYSIPYMLDAGTLLGAVRHGGFIPWDDDADIAMPRNSWKAFQKVASRELPEGMSLLVPSSFDGGKRFFDFTPRVIYDFSRRRKPDEDTAYYDEKMNHLWVDIFILDRLPDTGAGASFDRHVQMLNYLFAMGHRRKLDFSKYKGKEYLPVRIGSAVGHAVPLDFVFRCQEFWAERNGGKKTKAWYYSNYQPDYLYVTLQDEWLKDLQRIPFEDTTLSVSAHYDEVLKWIYGDYMKLPPMEKRVPSHGSREIEIYG